MGYPTWLAGEEITADKLNSLITAAIKTTSEAVTSSTTLQNDDALFVSVAASATYRMDLLLLHDSDATAAADIKVGWTGPAGATMHWGVVGANTASTSSTTVPNSNMQTALITETASFGGGDSTGTTALVAGTLVTSTTAGTLQLQWAQETSNAVATNVRAGSHLVLTRIA